MKTLSEEQFLKWAKSNGLEVDPEYPQSAVLGFVPKSGDARFWCVPDKPKRRPFFISSTLELMGDWSSCFVWRHLGSWPDVKHVDPLRINDVIEYRLLHDLGLPMGTTNVVEIPKKNQDTLIALIFSTTIFGWSVGEDLYVIPNHARYILQTDHHGVVHVCFKDSKDVDFWITSMKERGFLLPDELPDETFKKSAYIKIEG